MKNGLHARVWGGGRKRRAGMEVTAKQGAPV